MSIKQTQQIADLIQVIVPRLQQRIAGLEARLAALEATSAAGTRPPRKGEDARRDASPGRD